MLKLENSIRGLSFSRVAFDLTIHDPKDARMASFFLVPGSNKIDLLYIVEAECKNICIYVLNA